MSPRYVTFFLDHNVPRSVAEILSTEGYTVIELAEVMRADSPDQLVAQYVNKKSFILITCDKDFRGLSKSLPKVSKREFQKLDMIQLKCRPVGSPQRVQSALSFIKAEWEHSKHSERSRLFLDIGDGYLRTNR